MEVVMMPPSPVTGEKLMYRSTCTSPCSSAVQSPQVSCNNYFFSAPSSPTSSSPFSRQVSFAFATAFNTQLSDQQDLHDFHNNLDHEKISIINSNQDVDHHSTLADHEEDFAFGSRATEDDGTTTKEDFAFDFSGELERTHPLPANQLFQGSKTKPTEPPPKKTLQNALSFRQRKKYFDPCVKSRESAFDSSVDLNGKKRPSKVTNMVSQKANTKFSVKEESSRSKSVSSKEAISTEKSSSSSTSWYVKWKLPDLLFRSASEGHEANKKYEAFGKNMNENLKSTSSGGSRMKKEKVSGHELHYKVNRATAAEMRRKTFLPYKQNLMGCMDLDSLILEPTSTRGGINTHK